MKWTEYNWDDVTPVELEPVPGHVGQVAYSAPFKHAMGYFRAVSQAGERSERVLALTAAVIDLTPAHYSVWDYRLALVRELGNAVFDWREVGLTPKARAAPPIGEDGDWLNALTLKNPKNYQVWNYRQQLLDPQNALFYRGEKVLAQMVLEDDSKNFHTWSHLKWVVAQSVAQGCAAFGDGSRLVADSAALLSQDVYNNSAWSYRYFLFAQFPSLQDTAAELEFVAERLVGAADNESAWSYLHGYLVRFAPGAEAGERANAIAREHAQGPQPSPRAVEFLAERLPARDANALWLQLGELEPLRRPYWETRIAV